MNNLNKIEKTFVEGVEIIYDNFLENGVSLVYIGKFNHQVIKMFTGMAENEMEESVDNSTKRIVYHAMVEILQNMNKHSDEIADEKNIGRGLFMIGIKNGKYFIIASNKIKNGNITKLKSNIEEVNNCSLDELNTRHHEQLRGGTLSEKGGAGLGLIDIARKTSKKIQYDFIPINARYSYFLMKVVIDKRKITLRKVV
ncbi:MAG: SiaB family protein kinase [Bacteroidales bacterium]|nr:SiaB family protein kinase [Bacteroidales bacterium]MBN2757492.1 SiaB family protein kinase [Bacteroidales bacterium]